MKRQGINKIPITNAIAIEALPKFRVMAQRNNAPMIPVHAKIATITKKPTTPDAPVSPMSHALRPNDLKLSDGGSWRGACPTVERAEDAQM